MVVGSQETLINYLKSWKYLQRLQILRFARDWQDVMYDRHMLFFWDKAALTDRLAELESVTGQPWLGRESHGRKVFRTDGFYVDCRDPLTTNHGAGHRYVTTVQVQGAAFSRGVELGEALDEIETAIFGEIIPDKRVMGRVDLAFDIWIREGWPEYFEPIDLLRSIHRWGAASTALARDWKTHIRKPGIDAKVVGGELVETFYLGSRSVAMLRAYRKDIEFEGNTALHLGPVWRAAGWDGSGAVLRVEFEVKREYLRTHSLPNGKPLTSLSFDDWQRAADSLLSTLVNTIAHYPNYDPAHPDRSEPSQLWNLLQVYCEFARPAPRLRRFYAEPDEIETALALERAVWRAQEVLGEAEANRLIQSASTPTVPRVEARRVNWENGYLWTGYYEEKEHASERERRAREQGGQYEIEFGGRAQGRPGERSGGGAPAASRRKRKAPPETY